MISLRNIDLPNNVLPAVAMSRVPTKDDSQTLARAFQVHTEPFDGAKPVCPARRDEKRDAVHRASIATPPASRFGPPKAGFSRPLSALRPPCGQLVHGGTRALPADVKTRSNCFRMNLKRSRRLGDQFELNWSGGQVFAHRTCVAPGHKGNM